jgi:hypothetical protein
MMMMMMIILNKGDTDDDDDNDNNNNNNNNATKFTHCIITAHPVLYKSQQQRYNRCSVPIMLDCSAVAAIPVFISTEMTV